ncbi:MAG: hypothetical protein IKC33_00740 [Clostridia bacterium]|nr:hypothetical protein [Clostridia bacterium]
MKKLAVISLIIFIFSFLPCVSRTAFCDEIPTSYARITSDDCPFFADPSLKIIKFYIPKNYYVKIVSVGTESSRVIYMDGNTDCPLSEGYVKNVYLSFEELKGITIYPEITVYTTCDEVIFTDTDLEKPKAVLIAGTSAIFYGTLNIEGVEYLYVYAKGYVGYVRRDGFAQFDVPVNYVEPVTPPNDTDNNLQSSPSEGDSDNHTAQGANDIGAQEVIIIAVMIIAALSLIFLILRPERTNQKTRIFERDD